MTRIKQNNCASIANSTFYEGWIGEFRIFLVAKSVQHLWVSVRARVEHRHADRFFDRSLFAWSALICHLGCHENWEKLQNTAKHRNIYIYRYIVEGITKSQKCGKGKWTEPRNTKFFQVHPLAEISGLIEMETNRNIRKPSIEHLETSWNHGCLASSRWDCDYDPQAIYVYVSEQWINHQP